MARMRIAWSACALLPVLAACSQITPADRRAQAEVARIREHLAGALSELRARPVDELSTSRRQARLEVIGWLEEYRAAGVFPHNHVLRERTPVFVDPHGTPCAVGYLLLRSGETALVADVARGANLARIAELRDEPRLRAWLDGHGLTLDEAARIQPVYEPPVVVEERSPYAPATVGVSLVTAAAASLALLTEPSPDAAPWVESLTVATALTHLALVVIGNDTDSDAPTWARNVNVVGAVAGALVATDRLVRRSRAATAGGLTISPLVSRRDGRLDVGIDLIH